MLQTTLRATTDPISMESLKILSARALVVAGPNTDGWHT